MIIGPMFDHDKARILADASYNALENKLLSYGGRELVYVPECPIVTNRMLIEQGQAFNPDVTGVRMMPSMPNHCHDNCIAWWRWDRSSRLVHGYALSEDGLWRNHSWMLDGKDRIVETTVEREKYYGCIMDDALASAFAWVAGA